MVDFWIIIYIKFKDIPNIKFPTSPDIVNDHSSIDGLSSDLSEVTPLVDSTDSEREDTQTHTTVSNRIAPHTVLV